MQIKEKIKNLKKVILHDHLDGGLRVKTLIEFANKANIPLPYKTSEGLAKWFYDEVYSKDFSRVFETFNLTCSVMQTAENIERISFEFFEDHARENVIYVEPRFCPYFHTNLGLSYHDIILAIVRGMSQAFEKYDIQGGIIVCGMYHLKDEENLEIAKLCTEFDEVVGIDFAGMDSQGSLSETQPKTVAYLNQHNINITAHSGEFSKIENIADVLKSKARRIGHATNLFETDDKKFLEDTIRYIKDNNIHIESNVSSNIALGIRSSFREHPYKKIYDHGISTALNTDDRLMFGNLTITEEYFDAYNSGLDFEGIIKMNLNAANAAFTTESIKEELLNKIYQSIE